MKKWMNEFKMLINVNIAALYNDVDEDDDNYR